ncbi:MAG: hypothetical protein INQ03_20930 [Candidatus Heimdallarchaeota archaeon]|nr:hypothetical protein [Candidatus Heimdallarchaeota archaeon]
MSRVIDDVQLKHEINEMIEQQKGEIQSLTEDQKNTLIQKMLLEREFMIDEFEYLRENSIRYYGREGNRLLLSNFKDDDFNALNFISNRINISVGTILTEMFRIYQNKSMDDISAVDLRSIADRGRPKVSINGHRQMIVHKKDLDAIPDRISFNHIDKLILDIDEDTFIRQIASINHCDHVIFKQKVSRLMIYSKCNFVDKYTLA